MSVRRAGSGYLREELALPAGVVSRPAAPPLRVAAQGASPHELVTGVEMFGASYITKVEVSATPNDP